MAGGGWNGFGYVALAGVGIALLAFGDLAGRVVGAVLITIAVAAIVLAATSHRRARAARRDPRRKRLI